MRLHRLLQSRVRKLDAASEMREQTDKGVRGGTDFGAGEGSIEGHLGVFSGLLLETARKMKFYTLVERARPLVGFFNFCRAASNP